MDNQPISFTGTLTLQDALDILRYRCLCMMRPSFWWLVGFVSVLIATVCTVAIVLGKATFSLWIILFVCAYCPVGWWYEKKWAVRRQHRRHPEYYIENTVTMDESNMWVANANMDLRLAWNQIAFLLDTPRGLMFMLPPIRVLFWLPRRLFEGNDFKATIIGYATKNNVLVRTME